MKTVRYIYITSTLLSILTLSSCATVREKAKDTWIKEINAEKFAVFNPPREGEELGNIITFDDKGREYLVATPATCFPTLKPPIPKGVALLTTSSETTGTQGLSANIAQVLKGKVDLSFVANSNTNTKVSLKLGSPKIAQYELVSLKTAISGINHDSECYKAITNPSNLVVLSTLSVSSVGYEFKDSSDKDVKLTADILTQAKVSPELKQKFEGQASLIVDQPLSIGYRALAVRELPGLNSDKFDYKELSTQEVDGLKQAKIK